MKAAETIGRYPDPPLCVGDRTTRPCIPAGRAWAEDNPPVGADVCSDPAHQRSAVAWVQATQPGSRVIVQLHEPQ